MSEKRERIVELTENEMATVQGGRLISEDIGKTGKGSGLTSAPDGLTNAPDGLTNAPDGIVPDLPDGD